MTHSQGSFSLEHPASRAGGPALGAVDPMESARVDLAGLGFAKVCGAFARDDMAAVETLLDHLVANAGRSPEFSWRAVLSPHLTNEPSHPEVFRPALISKALRRSNVFVDCQRLAERLLGTRAHYLFDHVIYKLPNSGTGVHWHQDQAYLGPKIAVQSLHFWIPLQDVDEASGCLRFVPASHTGMVWRHTSAFEAHPHVLRADIATPASVVEQPLKLGDVGIHTNFTLHSSGPNRTNAVRKAWIIHFGDRPRWYKQVLRFGAMMVPHLGS
jgi:hypothetical protein